ncbi:MAG: hypothetical protein ACI4OP_07110 [Candidatus Coprovivens sp.]
MVTYKVKTLEVEEDAYGYTTYVFERLEYNDYDDQYIMCVKFPNWNQYCIEQGDVGFLTIKYVQEGIDKWFNGEDFIPYNYTNIIFIKFVREKLNKLPIID